MKSAGWIDPLLIYANRKDFAALTAGYAFTMLGFLAAIITILFTYSDTQNFQKYKKEGYLSYFFVCYFVCIITLMLTAFMSIYGFSSGDHILQHHVLLIAFVDSLWQLLLLTLIIFNLVGKSL